MDGRARLSLGFALALYGCGPGSSFLELPSADVETVVLVVSGPDPHAVVREVSDSVVRIEAELHGSTEVAVGFYNVPAAQLGLELGRQTPDLAGFRLAEPDSERVLDRDSMTWIDARSEGLRSFLFSDLTLEDCLDAGGCPTEDSDGACTLPCPMPTPPARAAAPALPDFLPCPSDWTESEVRISSEQEELRFAVCHAFVDDQPPTCDDGMSVVPGRSTCEPVGADCPAGIWPTGLPTSDVIYVSADATAPGDGSLADPFTRLDAAMQSAAPGATIALAKGSYPLAATVDVRADLEIVGACAQQTSVRSDQNPVFGVRDGAHLSMEDLRFQGSGLAVLVDGASLEASGVWFHGAGLEVIAGGALTVDDSLFEAIAYQAALAIRSESRAIVRRSEFRESPQAKSVFVGGASTATVTGVLLRSPVAQAIAVAGSAELRLTESHLEGATEIAALINDGARARIDQCVIRESAIGMQIQEQSTAHVSRTRIQASVVSTLMIYKSSGNEINDVFFSKNRAPEPTKGVPLLNFIDFAEVTVKRAVLHDTDDLGVILRGNAQVELADIWLLDVQRTGQSPSSGRGFQLGSESSLSADRVSISNTAGMGVKVLDAAIVDVRDLRIFDSRGSGLRLDGGETRLERIQVTRARAPSIDLTRAPETKQSPSLVALDVSIVDGQSGVECRSGDLSLERFDLLDNGDVGLRVIEACAGHAKIGRIRGHDVGIEVDPSGVPPEALSESVRADGNVSSLRVGP